MRLPLLGSLLLQLIAVSEVHAVGGYTGDYLAVGPALSFSQLAERESFFSGFEASAGRIDSHIGYGVWLDYQHALGSLEQDRMGAGLQLMTGDVGALGVDLGALAIRDSDDWQLAGRARLFVSTGWLGLAAGVGRATELGSFNEVTLLLKLPFSCEISGALPFFCAARP